MYGKRCIHAIMHEVVEIVTIHGVRNSFLYGIISGMPTYM